jgi:hypothetical protein
MNLPGAGSGDARGPDCDRERIRTLRAQLGYSFGALLECETRRGNEPLIR